MPERRRLVPLSSVREYRIAPDAPDVRGWDAVLDEGERVGEVTDLIVDRAVGRVRYVEVALAATADRDAQHVLIPIGTAKVETTRDRVIVPAAVMVMVAEQHRYDRGAVSHEYEAVVRERVLGEPATEAGATRAADDYYEREAYDERRFLAPRLGDEEGEEDDFAYLVGVGGAMTDDDVHPEPVGDVRAGQIRVPVMEEETRHPVAPEERRATHRDEERGGDEAR